MGSRRNTHVENIVPSDDEGYEDSGGDYSHSENDLEGIAGGVLENLNLKTSYMPEWGGGEAFREISPNLDASLPSPLVVGQSAPTSRIHKIQVG